MISVVVPIYKVEKYISKCIESIIRQTYKDLEIILVDDGSPDDCPSICDSFASVDGRIKVIHKENGGLSSARNAGLQVATGEWIIFIDSDDYIDENMLLEMMRVQEATKSQIVVCDFCTFEDTKAPKLRKNSRHTVEQYSNKEAVSAMFYRKGIGWNAWNKLFDIKLFSDICFPVGMYCEDCATIYKLYLKSEKVAYIKRQLYFYRVRLGSIMQNKPLKLYNDILMINEEICSELKDVDKKLYCEAGASAARSSALFYVNTLNNPEFIEINKKALLQLRKYYPNVLRVKFLSLPEKIFVFFIGSLLKHNDGGLLIHGISRLYKRMKQLISKIVHFVS